MTKPFLFIDFFNPDAPPQLVDIEAQENDQFRDLMNQWPVRKVLTARDIRYCQLIMPKDQVEDNILPQLLPDEQNSVHAGNYLPITMRDLETSLEYRLCLWKNGFSSYVLTKGWSSSFVKRMKLEVGELIGLYWDQRLRELRFSVLSRPPLHFQEGFGLHPAVRE